MLLVFCRDSLEPSEPDRTFGAEVAASERSGLSCVLVDYDALTRGDESSQAVHRVPEQDEPVLAVYRGWMLTPPQYGVLYQALSAKSVRLINNPEQYRHSHHLPENYQIIKEHTPRTIFLQGDLRIDRIMETLATLGDGPVIVKDFVKSRKHEWTEACFIPSAADRRGVERVVGRFLELQGECLAEGLVFREFVEFEPIGMHPKSGMPLTEEYRVFWLDGRPIFWSSYWPEGIYRGIAPPINQFSDVASAVQSRFFTMDIARRRDGGWMIMELGDGQVSGLPRDSDADGFYNAFANARPSATALTGDFSAINPASTSSNRL